MRKFFDEFPILSFAACVLVLNATFNLLLPNGKVEHCLVHQTPENKFMVVGFRSFMPNINIGEFSSFQEAVAAMKTLDCRNGTGVSANFQISLKHNALDGGQKEKGSADPILVD